MNPLYRDAGVVWSRVGRIVFNRHLWGVHAGTRDRCEVLLAENLAASEQEAQAAADAAMRKIATDILEALK